MNINKNTDDVSILFPLVMLGQLFIASGLNIVSHSFRLTGIFFLVMSVFVQAFEISSDNQLITGGFMAL